MGAMHGSHFGQWLEVLAQPMVQQRWKGLAQALEKMKWLTMQAAFLMLRLIAGAARAAAWLAPEMALHRSLSSTC